MLTSRDPAFNPGDIVMVDDFWRDHAVRKASDLRKLDPARPRCKQRLGVMGMPGLTAYAGLKHIGRPKAGETLWSAPRRALSARWSARSRGLGGARVVGLAGGPEKCAYVTGNAGL